MSESFDPFHRRVEASERIRRQNDAVLASLAHGGGGPHDPSMEIRVTRLEEAMIEVRAALARMEPVILRMDRQFQHLATKAELERVRGDVIAELATKPSRGAMWTMGIALFGLVVAAMATGAAYLPFLAERLHSVH